MELKDRIRSKLLFLCTLMVMVVFLGVTPGCRSDKKDIMPNPRGDLLLGMMVYPSGEGDYAGALNLCQSAGANMFGIGYSWSELEDAEGFHFEDVDRDNLLYSSDDLKVILEINPVETDWKSVPSHLDHLQFDDPTLIAKFKTLMDEVFARLSDLKIEALLIGNEVDGYLGDNDLWEDYRAFYEAVGAYARTIRPGIKIGIKCMYEGMMELYPAEMKELSLSSDIYAVTYYPKVKGQPFTFADPSVMHGEISALAKSYSDKKIYIMEIGYSTSPLLNGSQEKQANFVKEVFRIWDELSSQIKFVSFVMLHDYETEYIDDLMEALGLTSHPDADKIREGWTTLGLRTSPGLGTDKLAFPVLIEEAKKRGW